MDNIKEELSNKVLSLEKIIINKDKELGQIRDELYSANTRLKQLIERVDAEIKAASRLQAYLIPTEIPNIPGFDFSCKFIASGRRGGDYYDVFEHDSRFKFGLLMASFSGYSISSLFLSIILKMTGLLELKGKENSEFFVKKMVEELKKDMDSDDLADIMYAVVDRTSYEMNYTISGDITALFFQHSTQTLNRLDSTCGSINNELPDTFEFKSKTISLNPRDRVVFISRALANESPVLDDLYSLIESNEGSIHDLRNEIMFLCEKKSIGIKRDLSIIAFEVKDRVIKLAT